MNSPVKLGVSPTASIPHKFFQSEVLRLYFPKLEPWVAQCLTPQLFLLAYLHANVGLPGLSATTSSSPQAATFPAQVLQPPPCHQSSSPWLPISSPPTSPDECFLFNCLVVRLSYSSIFWQFCLFFVFKFFVVLILVVWGGTVYLPMPPSWPDYYFLISQSISYFWYVQKL